MTSNLMRAKRRRSSTLEILLWIGPVPVLEDVHEARNGFLAIPVALKLAIELRLGDELAAGLLDAAERGLVRGDRGATHCRRVTSILA